MRVAPHVLLQRAGVMAGIMPLSIVYIRRPTKLYHGSRCPHPGRSNPLGPLHRLRRLPRRQQPARQPHRRLTDVRPELCRSRGGEPGTYAVQLNAVSEMTESMFWVKGNLLQAKQCFIGIEPAALAYPQGRIAYVLRS